MQIHKEGPSIRQRMNNSNRDVNAQCMNFTQKDTKKTMHMCRYVEKKVYECDVVCEMV